MGDFIKVLKVNVDPASTFYSESKVPLPDMERGMKKVMSARNLGSQGGTLKRFKKIMM